MPRIFLPSIPEEKSIVLKGDPARYLLSVLRMGAGSEITLFDSEGRHFRAEITGIDRSALHVEILEALGTMPEPATGVVLLLGLLKGRKMDLVVQKATELWAREIVPVVTERSQVRETRKTERWRKIAVEASRQCGRPSPPKVHEPVGLSDYLDLLGDDSEGSKFRGFIFSEAGGSKIPDKLPEIKKDVIVAIGPEGGFTKKELLGAREKGILPVTLSGPILRAETAAISAMTLIQYLLGNF